MKKSQLERAIESLEGEVKVLQLAIEKLKQQASTKRAVVRKPRIVASGNV